MRRKFLHLSIILLTCALVVAIAICALSTISGELFAAGQVTADGEPKKRDPLGNTSPITLYSGPNQQPEGASEYAAKNLTRFWELPEATPLRSLRAGGILKQLQ